MITEERMYDEYKYFLETNLPFFMLLIYILPMYRLISNIVTDKETKARESMKIMGLKDFSYWFSWFAYHCIQVTIISIMCTIILNFNVIVHTNPLVLFLFFWLFGMSLFGFAIFI
jgi:ATP-binding cassette subfamily A (ABC1) protein 3